VFGWIRRNPLPKEKSTDFYWDLVKEADAKTKAAAAARDAAATEAERLGARVGSLEDELEAVRAALDARERELATLTAAHQTATAEMERRGAAVTDLQGELETSRATLDLRDRQFAQLGDAHGTLQREAAASASRVTELEAQVQTLSEERAEAIATAQAVREKADLHLAAVRGARDRLRAELESALESIVGVAERHRSELAAECRRALRQAAGIGEEAAPPADAALDGRRSTAEPVLAIDRA
jgi:chromosome segregation ATPase